MEDQAVRRIKAEADRGLQAARAGRADLAGRHFNNALNEAAAITSDRIRRGELAVLSTLFDMSGFPDLALSAAEDSVGIDRRLGFDDVLHEDLLNLGNAHLNMDNDGKAEQAFREALDHALARNEWANAASASTNLGNLQTKHGDMTGAIARYETSLEYLAKEQFDDTEINTRLMLLQASELAQADVERSIDNAKSLCARFWKDMQQMHRDAARQLIGQAVERYLGSHEQPDPGAWKAAAFPALYH
jgi:tetratricopeptide (TPR) repeat protein